MTLPATEYAAEIPVIDLAGFVRVPVHVGDGSREAWRTNWQDAPPAATGFDLGTLED